MSIVYQVRKDEFRCVKSDLRILPSFVVDAVEDGRFLVVGFAVLPFKDFSLVKELVMKAKSLLVLVVSGEIRSHIEGLNAGIGS